MKRLLCLAVSAALLAGFALSGCGASGGTGGKLEGIRWMLSSYSHSGTIRSVPRGALVDALFERGKVSGSSGVNTYTGSYVLSGSSLTVGKIASTLMAGPQDLMELEQDYLANLEKTRSYTAGSDKLTLFDSEGGDLMVYSRGRVTTLKGTNWEAVNYYNGRDAITGVINGTTITAKFGEDNKVSGSAGFNDYSADFKTDGNKISIGTPAVTTDKVDGNPDISRQQTDYLATLQLAARYDIRGETLTLYRSDGGIAVTYNSAD